MPLISVIVPCYKQAHFLEECITSVLAQTYGDWECIIVNDCSPDNTEEVAQEMLRQDSRIVYHANRVNLGLAGSRNAGMDLARGTFILPLDADDKIAPRYLELAAAAFYQNAAIKLLYCKAAFFGDKEGEWPLPPYNYSSLFSRNVIFCSALFRKADALAVGGFRACRGFEDWDLWLRLLDVNDIVHRLDYEGFFYRQLASSMITDLRNNPAQYREARKQLLLQHLDKFVDWTDESLYYTLAAASNFAERERRIDRHPLARRIYWVAKFISKW